MNALALLLTLFCFGTQREERVFFAELVVEGPLEEIVIEHAGGGETRVRGNLRAGERRSLDVPLVVNAPLWRETLPTIELPEPQLFGAGPSASAKLTGFVEPQPLAKLEALPPGLLARPLPPPIEGERPLRASTILALALAFVATIFLRRKGILALSVGVVGAIGMAYLVRDAQDEPSAVRTVLEGDLNLRRFQEVSVARDELPMPFDGLWTDPPGVPMTFELNLEGEGFARAAGARLIGRRVAAAPERFDLEHNGLGSLEMVWTRTDRSFWALQAFWPEGSPFVQGTAAPGTPLAPPGWLAGVMPPGEGLLVGRLESGSWVRLTGLTAPGGD